MASISRESSSTIDPEVKELVNDYLQKTGLIQKMKAQLRAAVFLALEGHTDMQPDKLRLTELLHSPEAQVAVILMSDFLTRLELQFSASVLRSEAGAPGLDSSSEERQRLAASVNEKLSSGEGASDEPLLVKLVRSSGLLDSNFQQRADESTKSQLDFEMPSTTAVSPIGGGLARAPGSGGGSSTKPSVSSAFRSFEDDLISPFAPTTPADDGRSSAATARTASGSFAESERTQSFRQTRQSPQEERAPSTLETPSKPSTEQATFDSTERRSSPAPTDSPKRSKKSSIDYDTESFESFEADAGTDDPNPPTEASISEDLSAGSDVGESDATESPLPAKDFSLPDPSKLVGRPLDNKLDALFGLPSAKPKPANVDDLFSDILGNDDDDIEQSKSENPSASSKLGDIDLQFGDDDEDIPEDIEEDDDEDADEDTETGKKTPSDESDYF